MELELPRAADQMRSDEFLFSESASRFLVTVPPERERRFVGLMALMGVRSFTRLGVVTETPELVIRRRDGSECIRATLDALKAAWQKPLNW